MLYPNGTFIQLFVAASALLDAFTFQINTFPIYLALKKRNSKQMILTVTVSSFITAMLYAVTGILGFFIYRATLHTVIIENLSLDIHKYNNTNLYICALLFVCTLSFYFSALFSAPLLFFSLRKYLITLLGMIKRKVMDEANEDHNNVNISYTQIIVESADINTRFMISIITYIIVLICTLNIDNLLAISSIVGSTVSNVISMIAPTLFIINLSANSWCSFEKILSKLVFTFGISILSMYFYTKIIVFF